MRPQSDASYLLVKHGAVEKEPIAEIEVKPREQSHISLGNFDSHHPPKGFAIHINPEPETEAITTQIISFGTDQEYELVLHIANYATKTISAEVWRL